MIVIVIFTAGQFKDSLQVISFGQRHNVGDYDRAVDRDHDDDQQRIQLRHDVAFTASRSERAIAERGECTPGKCHWLLSI